MSPSKSFSLDGEAARFVEIAVMAKIDAICARPMILALLFSLCACSGGGVGPGVQRAHSVIFNISEDPHSLNPLLAQSDDEQQIAHLAFDLLIDVDEKGRVVPALAMGATCTPHGVANR